VKKAYFFLIWTRVRISPDPPEGTKQYFCFVPFFISFKTLVNTKDSRDSVFLN